MYEKLKKRAGRAPSPLWWPHEQVVLAPIEPLFSEYFPEKNDPPPQNLSRHAVMHRLPLEHLSPGHCIIAIMLMVSLLREMEQRMLEAEIESWHENGGDAEEDEGYVPVD
ncbi:hypothetical protein [Streptomyces sp. NPDC056291]|uniref:hypothetical protein n=1 Tax=unclassified Streptomyces TaxID=2593676 RepID=UPI0035DA88E0